MPTILPCVCLAKFNRGTSTHCPTCKVPIGGPEHGTEDRSIMEAHHLDTVISDPPHVMRGILQQGLGQLATEQGKRLPQCPSGQQPQATERTRLVAKACPHRHTLPGERGCNVGVLGRLGEDVQQRLAGMGASLLRRQRRGLAPRIDELVPASNSTPAWQELSINYIYSSRTAADALCRCTFHVPLIPGWYLARRGPTYSDHWPCAQPSLDLLCSTAK
jgi:hypothetical protein